MPREQLAALAADVDRLLAAGASAAVGNDGLRRRGKTLRDLGQKVAALNPVADAIDRATQAKPNQAAPALLDLLVVSRQIRASLASAGVPGDLEPLPESGPWRTPLPVRDVRPLVQALTQSGPGREVLLKSTLERNAFADLRLVSGLLEALDDGYAPIAELVAREALPALGRAVLSDLFAGLNLQGKTADARRLVAICRIDASAGAELCRKALREGSQPVRVQALECLPDVAALEEAEQTGLALCLDKNREVRAAALWSLRNSSSAAALEALVKALVTDTEEQVQRRAADALATLRHPRTTQRLLSALEELQNSKPDCAPAAKTRTKKRPGPGPAPARDVQTISLTIEALANRRDKQRVEVAHALLPLAQGKDLTLRRSALAGLGGLGAVTDAIVPTLIEALADRNELIVLASLAALRQLRPDERDGAIPAILKSLGNPKFKDWSLRQAALSVLPQHMDVHGKKILATLAELLEKKDSWLDRCVFGILPEIGPPAMALLPQIFATLRRTKQYYIQGSETLLAAIDPEGKKALPELLAMLDDRKPELRCLALQLLVPYGKRAQQAEPAVQKLCDDSVDLVRHYAAQALPAIQ